MQQLLSVEKGGSDRGIPRQEGEQTGVVLLYPFVKLVFAVVELLADRTLGETPDRGVSTNLVLIWDEFDCFQRLSRRMLRLARDTTLWKIKCFETAPSAARLREYRPRIRLSSSGSLQNSARTPTNATTPDTNEHVATIANNQSTQRC